jgi:hypothetical protein
MLFLKLLFKPFFLNYNLLALNYSNLELVLYILFILIRFLMNFNRLGFTFSQLLFLWLLVLRLLNQRFLYIFTYFYLRRSFTMLLGVNDYHLGFLIFRGNFWTGWSNVFYQGSEFILQKAQLFTIVIDLVCNRFIVLWFFAFILLKCDHFLIRLDLAHGRSHSRDLIWRSRSRLSGQLGLFAIEKFLFQ